MTRLVCLSRNKDGTW